MLSGSYLLQIIGGLRSIQSAASPLQNLPQAAS